MTLKSVRLFVVLVTVALAGAAVYLFVQFQEPQIASVVQEENTHVLASEGYAGAESCKECLEPDYAVWAKSAHAEAMGIATPQTVKGDFQCDTTHTFDGQSYRIFVRGDT